MNATSCLLYLLLIAAVMGLFVMPIMALVLVVPWAAVGWYYAIFAFLFVVIRVAA